MDFESGRNGSDVSEAQGQPNNNELSPAVEKQNNAELGDVKDKAPENRDDSSSSSDFPDENSELPDTDAPKESAEQSANDANQNTDIPNENSPLPENETIENPNENAYNENNEPQIDNNDSQEQPRLSDEQKADLQDETGWPDSVVDRIKSPEEADIYKDAGLKGGTVDGKDALVRDIDPDITDEDGISNRQRMERGLSPHDSNGEKIELHHVGQEKDSPLAELNTSEHRRGGNDTILHDKSKESEVHGDDSNWDRERRDYWKARASDFE